MSTPNAAQHASYPWTPFYEDFATQLLTWRNRRDQLVRELHQLATRVPVTSLNDRLANGESFPLTDICPFTTIGIFNRGPAGKNSNARQKRIAQELQAILGGTEPVPNTYDGVPLLFPKKSWFFGYEYLRGPSDIENLWALFAASIEFAKNQDDPSLRDTFVRAYDEVQQQYSIAYNITMGLYWTRPWAYPTLDKHTREYVAGVPEISRYLKTPPSGENYLRVCSGLRDSFDNGTVNAKSFPDLSAMAWKSPKSVAPGNNKLKVDAVTFSSPELEPRPTEYDVSDIIADGSFHSEDRLKTMLTRIETKKNVVLQGPPGTGKTWLARRLAFALLGERDSDRVRAVQFHPNLSYEDFIRGWRPSGNGKLTLLDGPFMEMIDQALDNEEQNFVCVIEEINRGNPAQIFGEMLTLLESDKRKPEEALELSYKLDKGERVYIPENLHIIGTMNIADRSLAMLDLALRRRFAFITLAPEVNEAWFAWISRNHSGVKAATLRDIQHRINALNDVLAKDATLGAQYQIGHSYVTPASNLEIGNGKDWYTQVVETEIAPLLAEYWFDSPAKVIEQRKFLLSPDLA